MGSRRDRFHGGLADRSPRGSDIDRMERNAVDREQVLNAIKGPVKISYEPTINCNLRCPMCERTHKAEYANHRDRELPYERKLAFMREVGRLGARHFLFIGGGGPLADPHILEYMRILKSQGVFVHL